MIFFFFLAAMLHYGKLRTIKGLGSITIVDTNIVQVMKPRSADLTCRCLTCL